MALQETQLEKVEYVIATTMCMHGEELTYKEIRQHLHDVTVSIASDGVDCPIVSDGDRHGEQLFADAFEELQNNGYIGKYHPENAVRITNTSDTYTLTNKGYQFLIHPVSRYDWLTSEFREVVYETIAEYFEIGLRGFPASP